MRHHPIVTPILLGLLGVLSGSCTCARSETPPPSAGPARENAWALQIQVPGAQGPLLLEVGPMPTVSFDTEEGAAALRPKVVVKLPGGETRDLPENFEGSTRRDWALLWGATSKCQIANVTIPPWSTEPSWYVFGAAPTTCSDLLVKESQLLCVADALAEISDAVAPITWKNVDAMDSTFLAGDWVIPVQLEKTKFIARDLAQSVLAHLARLDGYPMRSSVGGQEFYGSGTCSRLWARGVREPLFANDEASLLFGGPSTGFAVFPSHTATISLSTAPGFAADALNVEAHILRAGARLQHDLIRRSFFADLAGAERRAGSQLDHLRGNAVAWGLRDAEGGQYNNLPHAARILSGRWELGATHPDPACGGIKATDILVRAYGAEGPKCTTTDGETNCTPGARDTDAPNVTPSQASASKLMALTGVVLPDGLIGSADLKSLVKHQLKGKIAKDNGISTTGDLDAALGTQAKAIDAHVEKISAEDFRFAAQRNLRTYQLLTSTPAPSTIGTPAAFLKAETDFVSPLLPSGAAVIAGGLERLRLVNEVMPRVGGLHDSGQCDEPLGLSGSLYADTFDWYPSTVPSKDRASPTLHQDSFSVGQAFLRRLHVLDEEADAAVGSLSGGYVKTAAERATRIARGGAVETRAWAGPARVFVDIPVDATTPLGGDFWFAGFDPAELNVAKGLDDTTLTTQMISKIALVYGAPWVAECAIHARTDCPADFDRDYVVHAQPSGGWWSSSWYFGSRAGGFPGTYGAVHIDMALATRPANFNPVFVGSTTPSEHLYVIATEDPKHPGKGMVLGSLALRRPKSIEGYDTHVSTSFPVASMQRELFDALLGLREPTLSPSGVGTATSAATGPSYCIDGVSKDIVPPLESELTSDGDTYESSWKHYLTLAKVAADRADALGQKLIDQGLSKDLRREAAGEAAAEVCGTPVQLDKIGFDKSGDIKTKGDDPAVEACLVSDPIDLTFLGRKPAGLTEPELLSFAHAALGCSTAVPADAHPLCSKASFKIEFLGIVDTEQPSADADCTKALKAMASVRSTDGFDHPTFQSAITESWASDVSMSALVQTLRMEVEPSGTWRVRSGGYVVMDSADIKLWPGCMTAAGGCAAAPLAASFNKIFRDCADPETAAMGTCGMTASATAESNMLRFRVQSAMLEMAAFARTVPAGMFTIPMPIVDQAAGGTLPTDLDPMMVYDARKRLVEKTPGSDQYEVDVSVPDGTGFAATTVDERRAMGVIRAIQPSFRQAVFSQLPPWYEAVYGAAVTPYRHVFTSNPAFTSSLGGAGSDLDSYLYGSHGLRADTHGAVIQSLGALVQGVSCSGGHYGTASRGPFGGSSVHAIVRSHGTPLQLLNSLIEYNKVSRRGFGFGYGGLLRTFHLRDNVDDVNDERAVIATNQDATTWWSERLLSMAPIWGAYRGFLSATDFAPANRTAHFLPTWVPPNICTATTRLAQTMSVACVLSGGPKGVPTPKPPPITDENDLSAATTWMKAAGASVKANYGVMYLEGLPVRAVRDIQNRVTASGSKKGSHGAKLIEIENRLLDLGDSINEVNRQLDSVANGYRGAQLEVEAAKLGSEITKIRATAEMARAGIRLYEGIKKASMPTSPPGEKIGGISELAQAAVTIKEQMDVIKADKKLLENQVGQILLRLSERLLNAFTETERQVNGSRKAVNDVNKGNAELASIGQKARMKLAQAAGEDFALVDGKIVEMPVNAVNNRMYSIAKHRYDRALADAKYLAYMARKAIELRVGVRLDEIEVPVGVLPAPQTWANDICTLTGIKYEDLSKVDPDAGPSASKGDLPQELKNAFVGDYVDKLANFVEYYNIAYPSHDGDDTAILSLKDDLLAPEPVCTQAARNLLYYSQRPYFTVAASPLGGVTPIRRWQLAPCSAADGKCIRALPKQALGEPITTPDSALKSEAFWLRDDAFTESGGDAGADAGGDGGPSSAPSSAPVPSSTLTQEVQLEPGSYVFTWWDQARLADGTLATAATAAYRAGVWAADGTLVTSASPLPYVVTSVALWGDRRSLKITIATSGRYRVGFSASAVAGVRGSVALANPQLERVLGTGDATAYQATDETTLVPGSNCAVRSAASLRSLFNRACVADSCYYELTSPLVIDTRNIVAGSALAGKIARGNFNYRHITLAVNLVGTGVRDCSDVPSAGCFGSGYLEYTLRHDGSAAPVLDWAGHARVFDFGIGQVEHGKALTAERYITTPIGSADGALLGQPGIEKPEFKGRPLDGSYNFRIFDHPALRWNRLEDVQFVLKYRYWSRVTKSASKG